MESFILRLIQFLSPIPIVRRSPLIQTQSHSQSQQSITTQSHSQSQQSITTVEKLRAQIHNASAIYSKGQIRPQILQKGGNGKTTTKTLIPSESISMGE